MLYNRPEGGRQINLMVIRARAVDRAFLSRVNSTKNLVLAFLKNCGKKKSNIKFNILTILSVQSVVLV